MKIKDYTKEELETMNYDDIAVLVLEESGKKLKINDLFQKVCQILALPESEFEGHIADFFELLSTDKKFIMLENGYWDLRTKHTPKIVVDDEDDETIEENVEEDDENDEENIFYETDDENDEEEDELQDLVVVDVDEEESSSI